MTDSGWRPTVADMLWTQNLIGALKDGGEWGTSWGAYKIDHTNQVAHFRKYKEVTGSELDDHNRVKLTLEAMGWEVKDSP
jgi:hypothetical protein